MIVGNVTTPAETGSAVTLTSPAGFPRLVGLGYANDTAAELYFRGTIGGSVVFNFAITPGSSGWYPLDIMVNGSLSLTASTSSDGSGAPSGTVTATPSWGKR